jgi:hypothetical protein
MAQPIMPATRVRERRMYRATERPWTTFGRRRVSASLRRTAVMCGARRVVGRRPNRRVPCDPSRTMAFRQRSSALAIRRRSHPYGGWSRRNRSEFRSTDRSHRMRNDRSMAPRTARRSHMPDTTPPTHSARDGRGAPQIQRTERPVRCPNKAVDNAGHARPGMPGLRVTSLVRSRRRLRRPPAPSTPMRSSPSSPAQRPETAVMTSDRDPRSRFAVFGDAGSARPTVTRSVRYRRRAAAFEQRRIGLRHAYVIAMSGIFVLSGYICGDIRASGAVVGARR